ncbi:transferrin-binding protein-like solute binding protein [Roseivivax sp. GX 12232]|uniref:transferrin-binding protein-like solute binding protein n=1 Tax=Roseivivax sp. GX 12232 TaxID=2900547 RepID=UPI001E2B7446|nr:transferrin-binding protein-like solute binding protein [Roseivivax sp. GX 12232]MCE0505589.1 transferrin-binding protein-like solute binding protein [Roseivivax sp. GX 12232]
MRVLILGASALSLLAACSTGGGSSSDSPAVLPEQPAFKSFQASQEDGGTYRAAGQVTSADFAADENGDVEVTREPETENRAVIDVTWDAETGEATKIWVRNSKSNFVVDTADGGEITTDGDTIVAIDEDRGVAAVFADPEGQGLEYQSFGAWQTGVDGLSGSAGVGSFGSYTMASQLPDDDASATYNGQSYGQTADADGNVFETTSDIEVTTDFSAITVNSSNTSAGTTSLSDLDFTATGQLNRASFEATSQGDVSGTVTGRFYGPEAEEVGGTFVMDANDNGYIGAFGGVQQP